MKYIAMDGYEMEAENYRELAERMWKSMFIPDPTIEEWMEGIAKREKMWDGAVLRTSSVDDLVADMFATGRITALE